jgi:hypothetical protein
MKTETPMMKFGLLLIVLNFCNQFSLAPYNSMWLQKIIMNAATCGNTFFFSVAPASGSEMNGFTPEIGLPTGLVSICEI